jgi:phosphoenolpyruvate carboxylase
MEVYGLLLLSGWKPKELAVDIVPLFETVDDLEHAPGVMKRCMKMKCTVRI